VQMVGMERARTTHQILSARDIGLVGCRNCSAVSPADATVCGRCSRALMSRDTRSQQRVWAWWVAGLMCYVPANLYPMLKTHAFFQSTQSTIVGGAVELAHHGSYGIALIIFVASVVIPIGKFLAIAFLLVGLRQRSMVSQNQRHSLYEIVEYIGRWSMIDVFVVAILSSLVQLNTLVSIAPGPASLFFALSVIFTMLSAQSFDPRMIWDMDKPSERADQHD
jgi:paraquat-inducible protein A